MDKLFVYGSLMPHQKNFFILKDIPGNWQKAFIFGFIKKIKLEKDFLYDAIILNSNKNKVNGYLLTSYALKNFWKKIDYFESENYCRLKTDVFILNRQKTQANLYVLKQPKL
jgi:gamma-glutamylcyclotransferase (GGCT)/AIG2-like uncharacterized protein YtfP